jgi:N-acetylglucosamine malate deacetylase 1
MNVLCVAPHPDDECIGCGGALVLHARHGDRVEVVFLTSGELGLKTLKREDAWATREAEARRACRILKVSKLHFLRQPDWFLGDHIAAATESLKPVVNEFKPDLVYLPHALEWHPDHQATMPIVRAALAGRNPQPVLRAYEIWTPMAEHTHVENITAAMQVKVRALRQHLSQIGDWDYVRAVRGLNTFRGVMTGRCRYAEVFHDLAP